MGVYELTQAGSVKTPRTNYSSMNAGNQYGAMVPIAQLTGTGSGSEVAFTNIPQTFQDLMIVINTVMQSSTVGYAYFYLNSYSSPTPSWTRLYGNGTSVVSDRASQVNSGNVFNYSYQALTQTPTSSVINILNYSNTSTFKTVLARGAGDVNGSGSTSLTVGLQASTAPITSMNIATFASNAFFTTGSTFTLYGIRAVSS